MTDLALHQDFLVQGHLEALGTPIEPITFTSLTDTGPGQWGGLAFDGGTGHLNSVTIRYTGERNSVSDLLPYAAYRSGIAIHNGTLRLDNVTIRDQVVTNANDYGIIAIDSHLMLTDTLFTGIGDGSINYEDAAIRFQGSDTVLEMTGCNFTGNANDVIMLEAGAMMGHDTTLTPQSGLDGYLLESDFTVPPTVTLTIEPGVTVMGNRGGNNSAELRIEGDLDAIGTPSQPITFTSFDDSAPAQWPGLVFDGRADAGTGHLQYATVRYGGIGNSVLYENPTGYHSGSNITVYDVQTVKCAWITLPSHQNTILMAGINIWIMESTYNSRVVVETRSSKIIVIALMGIVRTAVYTLQVKAR